MAFKSISSGKLRSLLTMLGVIIGLAAVIIMVSYAKGQNMAIQQYYQSLGNNRITVYASSNNVQDIYSVLLQYCVKAKAEISGFTPDAQIYNDMNIQFGFKRLSSDNYDTYPSIYLGNEQFSLCKNYQILVGRDLSFLDIKDFKQVCVLGYATAKELFGASNPLHQAISINGIPFTVVGVYRAKAKKVAGTDEDAENISAALSAQDRMILLPFTATRLLNNNQSVQEFTVKAKSSDTLTAAITGLSGFLQQYIGNSGYFSVYSNDSYIQENSEASAMQQRFLGGIAAISLLVGGIGIMNIMLVTVKERTREIGIRKAIGAERKSIIAQFLIEAAVLCGIGGLLGIIIGYFGTLVLGKVTFNTILLPDASVTLGAFIISVALGIIFGLYPAAKASRLPPVEALRAE